MKKIKNYINNHKTISIILIAVIIITIGTVMFLTISYDTEKGRYDTVKKYCNNDSFAVQTEYELDKQEHEMNVDNLVVTSMPNYTSAYNESIGVGEYNRSFVGDNKFIADKVKKETYTIRTEVPKNKIWNKFKYVDTPIEVSCIDTTAPEFTKKVDSITINKGDELDIVSKFSATDLSGEAKITVDGNVDVNTISEQVINVYATDDSGNVVQTEVNIIVNETEEKNDKNTELNNNNATASKSNGSTSTSQKVSSQKSTTSASSSTKNNNKTSSNSNNKNNYSSGSTTSSTSKPNNNSGSTTTTSGCASGNHSMPTGNMGKWFNSRAEVEEYCISISNMWEKKYSNGTITWEEKCNNAPQGYEAWSCSRCGKWTGNFKY